VADLGSPGWQSGPGTSISLERFTPTGGSGSKPGRARRACRFPSRPRSPTTPPPTTPAAARWGEEDESFWRDHKGAGVNAIRTQTLIRAADLVVVRFGDKYRQWNAAFDAGFAAALGKPIVTVHDPELDHPLKEVDRAAQATAREAEQVVDVLRYVIRGELP
jgi:YtoQ family protein